MVTNPLIITLLLHPRIFGSSFPDYPEGVLHNLASHVFDGDFNEVCFRSMKGVRSKYYNRVIFLGGCFVISLRHKKQSKSSLEVTFSLILYFRGRKYLTGVWLLLAYTPPDKVRQTVLLFANDAHELM